MKQFTSTRITFNRIMAMVLFSSIIFSTSSYSQTLKRTTSNQMNIDSLSSFFKIQEEMNKYWNEQNVNNGHVLKNGVESKAPNWKLFKRWEYYWEQRVNPTTGEFPKTNAVIEYQKYLNSNNTLNKTNFDESWTNLGTNSSTGGYAGIGRINCIAFHPSDLNTFWVGSPAGGIWKTTSGGTSWAILNNNQLVLGVSDIVVDYTNPNILYIATGDRDGGSMWSLGGGQAADNVSIGVLKSTDGGSTWNTTGFSFNTNEGKKISRLLIHPSNNSILFAAMWDGNSSTSGIWKSTDAGATWVKKTSNLWIDMEFKPGDPTIMYASSYGFSSTYLNRSTDSGETWALFSVAASGRRGEIAVTASDPNIVYLLSANSAGGVYGVYKSTNSGVSFNVVNAGAPAGMLGYYTDGSGGSGGQGSYDWCIAASPTDPNTVFIGGITTWKSTDGGINFTANTNWTSYFIYNISGVPVVHADKHALAFQNSTTLFEGNDGGIYKTTNGGTNWSDLSNGLVISQLYRIGVSQSNPSLVLTGLQDNGSKLYNTGFWSDVTGGDGMECIVDYSTATNMYATYVRGEIYRSTNSGVSFPVTISANIPGGQPTGAWVTPYVIDPNNSATLFAGYDQVWKTTNRGTSWTSASQQLSASTKLRSLAIAPSNSNYLYAADQTNMWRTTDGGTTSWNSITLPSTSTSVTYIAVHATDPNILWITYGGYVSGQKVYQSTNGGSSWTSIAAGLPNLPIMSIVHYKKATDRNVLFVGSDVGVYVKDGNADWVQFNTGLPNVVVSELEVLYTGGTDKLRAGTFGRGLWETNIDALLPVELTSFNYKIKNNSVMLSWITQTEVNNFGFEVERSVIPNGDKNLNFVKIAFVNGNGNSSSPKEYLYTDKSLHSGKYAFRLKQIDNDGQYAYSNIIEVDFGLPSDYSLEQNYPNPFNPSTTIKYSIPSVISTEGKNLNVTLKIYDVLGNEVTTLVNEYKPAGTYEVDYNASKLSSGVYYYQLSAGSFTQVRKMAFIK